MIYVPAGIRKIENPEFQEFYGSYTNASEILSIEAVVERTEGLFQLFSWRNLAEFMPKELVESFERFRSHLQGSHLSEPLKNMLIDEYVFLVTRSSVLSRLKKTFKLFESLDALPLINLERIVPEEWRAHVRHIKKAVNLVNYIALTGSFAIWLGQPGPNLLAMLGAPAVKGIRMFLIDP